jgi:tetratricopeptide (TPR) repeat protein
MRSVQQLSCIVLSFAVAGTSAAQHRSVSGEPMTWQAHEERGTSELNVGRPDLAVVEYIAATELAPKQPGLHEELGDAIWSSSRTMDAAFAYAAEIALNPDCTSSLFKLGSLEVIRSEPQIGMELLKRALAIDPSLLMARYYLGKGEESIGLVNAALDDFQAVTVKATNDSERLMAWYQLAFLYRRNGQPSKSAHAFEVFREIQKRKAAAMLPDPVVPKDRKRELPHPPPSPM